MKKEVVLAIIVGFSLGLIITFGIYRAQKSIQKVTEDESEEQVNSSESPRHSLTVTQPMDGDIVDDDMLVVSGVTSAKSLVAVLTNDDEATIQADELGNFSAQVEISAGSNDLIVSSYDTNGNQVSTELVVVFSTADLDDNPGDETQEDSETAESEEEE